MKQRIKLVQQLLKEKGWYAGSIDGLMGPNTLNGIANLPEVNSAWPVKRKVNGAIQAFANQKGIPCKPIDGFWGPITDAASERLNALVNDVVVPPIWRPEDAEDTNPNNWPKQYTPEFDAFYGAQGDHLKRVNLPYVHKLSWEPSKRIRSFSCHEKVADSMERVLTQVLDHYGQQRISELRLDVWGGCFNIRTIRGGSKPSMHSWGIAVDYDPNRNKLRWGADKAVFAQPEYKAWWEIWEAEGWLSLGRSRNFDWMHIQAAKI